MAGPKKPAHKVTSQLWPEEAAPDAVGSSKQLGPHQKTTLLPRRHIIKGSSGRLPFAALNEYLCMQVTGKVLPSAKVEVSRMATPWRYTASMWTMWDSLFGGWKISALWSAPRTEVRDNVGADRPRRAGPRTRSTSARNIPTIVRNTPIDLRAA
jgi:hypothetical protein